MKWRSRPLGPAVLGTLLAAINAMAATSPTGAATKPLQFTSGGHIVGFTPKDVLVATGSHALRVEFVGAQGVEPIAAGAAVADGKAAPLIRVTYPGIWSGITLAYDAPAGLMRSTYTVAPGADPSQIRLRYNAPIAVEPSGELRVSFATGAMFESAPVAWQEKDGRRVAVSVAFRKESEKEVGFALGPYDKARPLTIDPTLTWNTFLGGVLNDIGGPADDGGYSIAVDASGNIYVTGQTRGTWGDPILPFLGSCYAFVAKLDANGALLWNTFLGGSETTGFGIAVDATGKVYVTGNGQNTWGTPIRPRSDFMHYMDVFVAKLDTNGALLWNTFLDWTPSYSPSGIAVDVSGNVYVAAASLVTWGAPIRTFAGGYSDGFLAKLDTDGALLWNTFLGGADNDYGTGITVDASGNVYVTGESRGPWGDPIRPFAGPTGVFDAFVAKLDSDGNLLWNTFLGGNDRDYGGGIVVDASSNIYVAGRSLVAWGTPIRGFAGSEDAFVAKLDTFGALIWNTFLGGESEDDGQGITADAGGNVYVTGTSFVAWGAPIRPWSGSWDGYVARLDTNGDLIWNTFLGGAGKVYGMDIALDTSGNGYVTGLSYGTWGDPIRPWGGVEGSSDAFVAKLTNITDAPPLASDQAQSTLEAAALALTLSATDADGDPLTYIVVTEPTHGTLSGTAPDLIYQPAADFFGSDSFTFKANDGSLDSNIATVNITVTAETVPPTGSILINNGAASTGTAAAILNLSAADTGGSGLASMRFRSNTLEPYSAWEPFQVTKAWTLTGEPGTRKVYAQFMDWAGNLSDANAGAAGAQGYMDAIVYDPVAPTGSILINNGAASTGTTIVKLKLAAADTGGSGLGSMRFRNNTADPYSAWEPCRATKSWALTGVAGIKHVYVQFKDSAGNVSDANPAAAGSQAYKDTIQYTGP